MNRKYFLAAAITSVVFLLNAAVLWFQARYDGSFRNDPIYPSYLRLRSLLLQPSTIFAVICVLGLWAAIVYWRSRTKPLSETQKIVFMWITLAAVYGYILTAFFRL